MKFRPVVAAGQAPSPFQSSSSNKVNQQSAFQRRFSSGKLQSATTPHDTSTTTTPRSSKRHKLKTTNVAYPTDVAVPSKHTIKALYLMALKNPESYQCQLDGCNSGLLSLEDVLVPAVISEQVNALKRVQAKAQRDSPPHVVKLLEECRRALYESGQHAIVKAGEARLERSQQEARQDAIREEERRVKSEQRRAQREATRQRHREERAVAKAAEKERLRNELKKKLPQNVDLWREVASFMSELTKLEKEEQLWKQTEETLKSRECELAMREETALDEEESIEETVESNKDELAVQIEHAVEDITLSSLRIQQALRLVSDLVMQSTNVQKELYDKYTSDHQFHGYRGVKNPKALIRAMATAD